MADTANQDANEQAKKRLEEAKQRVAEDRKASEQSRADYAELMKGKPTPTQEENDLAMYGALILEKEDDGSGPDRHRTQTRQLEADKPGGKPAAYTTRSGAGTSAGKAE